MPWTSFLNVMAKTSDDEDEGGTKSSIYFNPCPQSAGITTVMHTHRPRGRMPRGISFDNSLDRWWSQSKKLVSQLTQVANCTNNCLLYYVPVATVTEHSTVIICIIGTWFYPYNTSITTNVSMGLVVVVVVVRY